jgi:hypothetical protein
MAYKTIRLDTDALPREYTCDGAITPGHLCEPTSAGKMKVHATAGGSCARIFAIEDESKGGEIDTAYTTANQGQFITARPGDRVIGRLASGESVSIGDKLESDGAGSLRKVLGDSSAGVIDVQSVVGWALEAKATAGIIQIEVM